MEASPTHPRYTFLIFEDRAKPDLLHPSLLITKIPCRTKFGQPALEAEKDSDINGPLKD